MDHQYDSPTEKIMLRYGLALMVLLAWLLATAHGQEQPQPQPETSNTKLSVHLTHILGFKGVHGNVSGQLLIDGDALEFQRHGDPAARVNIASIQNISLGEQDKQVGGMPMMLGKSAVPFGGGRVVSLFSHKKYDSLTIEYLDENGGLHIAIFRVNKGAAQKIKDALIANGAHIGASAIPASMQTAQEQSLTTAEQWSVQVERVDPGTTSIDPSFSGAIYENLLKDLAKSKQFKAVFRSGDRNITDPSGVLVLKTVVKKYNAGSETRRAVTTVTGATKLSVEIQLLTRDGDVVVAHTIQGNVRLLGDNLRATDKVAHHAAKQLQHSKLPEPGASVQPKAVLTSCNDVAKDPMALEWA